MSTSIAFLSGKGGSGKTTFALSISDLLRRCEVSTLLVDCDLSTNGATYFYESQLADWNKSECYALRSFSDIVISDLEAKIEPYSIAPNLDFIPSILGISEKNMFVESVNNRFLRIHKLERFFDWIQQNYDVVIFDCQAGYTELLTKLLPFMDVDVFVMEADSISASAMRNLHLKIGNYLSQARLYQVFNKATPEEFEIYSKIVGTFFTNIGTLLFDWKIRQAFSRSQVPDIENTSSKYGLDLCEISKIFFSGNDISERLTHFSNQLSYKQLEEKRQQIEDNMYKSNHKLKMRSVYSIFYFVMSCVICILVVLFKYKDISDVEIIGLISIPLVIAQIKLSMENWNTRKEEQRKYMGELKLIDRKLKEFKHISLD